MKSSLIFIKDPRLEGDRGYVKIRLNWCLHRASFGTGNTIAAKHWDDKLKHVKMIRGNQELRNAHAAITRQQVELEQDWNRLNSLQKKFTAAEFKAYLVRDLDPLRGKKMVSFRGSLALQMILTNHLC
jgi:hypothetical protein